jgi:hypothetical protein
MADPYVFANLAPNEVVKAKDLFRAYGLSPLPLERGAEGFDTLPAQSRQQLFQILRQSAAPTAERSDVTVTGPGGRPLGTALPGPEASTEKTTSNRFSKYVNPPDQTAPAAAATAPARQNRFAKYTDDALPAPRQETTFLEDAARIAREVVNPNVAPLATAAGAGFLAGGPLGAAVTTGGLLASDLAVGGVVNPLLQAFGQETMMTPSEAINALYGQNIVAPEATSSGRRAMRTIGGFVAPTRATIGVADDLTRGVTGNVFAPTPVAPRNALIEPGVTRNVLTTLADKPGAQTVAAIGGGAGVGAAQEAGTENPFLLTGAALAGGVAPSLATMPIKAGTRALYNITEPFTPGGAERVKARAYLEAFNNDPNKVQQAINLLELGTPPEKVATAMNASGFAALLGTARNADTIIKDLYLARDSALQQGRANQLASATRSINALRDQLDQEQTSRLIALSEQDEAAQKAVRQEREKLAGRLPKESQLEVGSTVTERRAQELDRVKKEVISPAYRAAFDAAPEPFSFDLVAQTARALMDDSGYVFNPEQAPNAARAVAEYQSRVVREPYASVMGQPATRVEPTMITLEDADAFIKAINEDLAVLTRANDAGSNRTVGNLMRLKTAAEKAIEEGTQGTEAAKLYKQARTLFTDEVIGRFRTGWVSDLERQTTTNVQKLAPESVVKTILSGEENALRFVAALGEDSLAVDAVRRGIIDNYRRAVVRKGVIDPAKSTEFLRRHDDALNALEESGVKIFDDLRAFDEQAAKLAETGETVTARVEAEFTPRADELKTLERQARVAANKVGVDPQQSAATLDELSRTSDDVAQLIRDVRRDLADQRRFKTLVREGLAAGGGVRELASEQVGPKLQLFDQIATYANFLLTRAQGRVDAKLAVEIAKEMINAEPAAKALADALVQGKRSKFGERLQKPAERPGRGAVINVLAPIVTNQNSLRE